MSPAAGVNVLENCSRHSSHHTVRYVRGMLDIKLHCLKPLSVAYRSLNRQQSLRFRGHYRGCCRLLAGCHPVILTADTATPVRQRYTSSQSLLCESQPHKLLWTVIFKPARMGYWVWLLTLPSSIFFSSFRCLIARCYHLDSRFTWNQRAKCSVMTYQCSLPHNRYRPILEVVPLWVKSSAIKMRLSTRFRTSYVS